MVESKKESSYDEEAENELGLLIRERNRAVFDDRNEELNIHRSGSAPPTVEGSLSALGYGPSGGSDLQEFARNVGGNNGFMSDEEQRSDSDYLSYYYTNVNLNPRLPPPLLSKEDWRSSKRLQGSSSSAAVGGDRRIVNRGENVGSRSLLSNPPGFGSKKQDIASGSGNVHGLVEWGGGLKKQDIASGSGNVHGSIEWGGGSKKQDVASGSGNVHGLIEWGGGSKKQDFASGSGNVENVHGSIEWGGGSKQQDIASGSGNVHGSIEWGAGSKKQDIASGSGNVHGLIEWGGGSKKQDIASGSGNVHGSIEWGGGSKKQDIASGSGNVHGSIEWGGGSKKQDIASGSGNVHGSIEWSGDGLIGLPGIDLGNKQKSIAENFQGDFGHSIFVSKAPSRPISRNAFDDLGSAETDLLNLRSGSISIDPLRSSLNLGGQPASYSYAAALGGGGGGGSSSRSTTPDPHAIARAPSPGLAPIGGGRTSRNNITSPNSLNGFLSNSIESKELAAALSGMNIGNNAVGQEENRFPSRIEQEINENYLSNFPGIQQPSGNSSSSSSLAWVHNNAGGGGGGGIQSQYHHMDSPNSLIPGYNLAGYPVNLPPLFENAAAASAIGTDPRMLWVPGMINSPITDPNLRMAAATSGLQSPYMDSTYPQYLPGQIAPFIDPSVDPRFTSSNYYTELSLQRRYLEGLQQSPPQNPNFGSSGGGVLGGTGPSRHSDFYGIPRYGSYPQSQLVGHNSPPVGGPGSPMRRHSGDFSMRSPSGMRNVAGGSGVSRPWEWEELKNNKSKCIPLAEIAGHIVEFSGDQYGSRFIQQKLEIATIEEKNRVYDEIYPHALILMTDVFGNYVIQKFFEHGTASQRRELARKLNGNVLSMSLQMYGCRVIQKALEVVDEDQKICMVKELDGQIMRCLYDQNGNHVIQKCIEWVPEEHIYFIVSTFFGQVVNLSIHPYGCRVIQRILEHCCNPGTQSKVLDEILLSVSELTQDQYGNYVIQHVLEHGKPNERSKIIHELAPKIVEMSQQKYASNVVEKCLKYGNPNEVQLLVNVMLGTTDENESLQTMMKDQYANYVVQKVLETCSDHQRDLIMSRIKVHLNALKRYTYGKHIVSRLEKLLIAGEKRMVEKMNQAY